jgi:hypothetical protein
LETICQPPDDLDAGVDAPGGNGAGAVCTSDDDCDSGMRCLQSVLNGEGTCWHRVSGDQIAECVARCSWDSDSDCMANTCTPGNEEACADVDSAPDRSNVWVPEGV